MLFQSKKILTLGVDVLNRSLELPIFLFHQGTAERAYDLLGVHPATWEGIPGHVFRVWAPNARQVYLSGTFNNWNQTSHPMIRISSQGIWERFQTDLQEFDSYKYVIEDHQGIRFDKADPYSFHMETRPATASKIYDIEGYRWGDQHWMTQRAATPLYNQPVSIYEVHLGSWKKYQDGNLFDYAKLAAELAAYVKDMGYTHIELMPISEYPFDGSWGYQVMGYFAPTSRYGSPKDFMAFVDHMHANGIGVILDWVPGHFPKDAAGLSYFDGGPCYEYSDGLKSEHKEWGTMIFDWGRNEVRSFLLSNAVYWLEKYHIDGLRVDAVASMLYLDYGRTQFRPNVDGGRENLEAVAFLRDLNKAIFGIFPNVMMIAEESTAWPLVTKPVDQGGLGFNFKWNMGWMNDTTEYIKQDPYHKRHHHNSLTFSLTYAFSENYILPLSHDEVVHGKCSMLSKMPGIYEDKFANLRAYYAYMYAHPGKKLLFMGGEFAQFSEWNYATELDWLLLEYDLHKKMQNFVRDLNHFYREDSCFWELDDNWEGFRWIDPNDYLQNILTFQRKNKAGESLIVACNFAPVHRSGYRLGVEEAGTYEPVFHTEEARYGGNGTKIEIVNSMDEEWLGFPYTIAVDLPPLSTVFFKKKTKKITRKAR